MEYLARVRSVENKDELIDVLAERGQSLGFQAVSYILPTARDSNHVLFLNSGYPRGWAERYQKEQLNLVDPVLLMTMQSALSIRYADLWKRRDLRHAQTAFLSEEKRVGLGDGYAIPVFGRFLKVGWITFRQASAEKMLEDADLVYLEALAHATHIRCDQIVISEREAHPSLAPREQTILQWMAAGKTNGEIATILSIGAPTVATYIRRMFQKLDVTDRTSAVTKGIRFGLINP